MAKVVYQIVEHDAGWAYSVDGVYSETYPTRDAAHAAADRAAREQRISGDDAAIAFEDATGRWQEDYVHGEDRPETEVQD